MGIPLSELLDEGNESMRDQASANNLPYEPFTMRELITPQYRPDEVGLASSSETWTNWVGQHRNWENDRGEEKTSRNELRPTDRKQLIAAVVTQALSEESFNGEKVRAVGSGHSHSNAPAPEGTYIELDPGEPGDAVSEGLNSVLDSEWLKSDVELQSLASNETNDRGAFNPLSRSWLKPQLDREHLKRVESGIILRRLNRHVLHENGYALQNMGSFDGQTIAGAVNTSTHGTGIGLPAISDAVQSVEIATVPRSQSGDPIVRMYRIEPSDGITDREAFEADTGTHEMELIQDDDVFHSVVVGYGCMGVVYAYTLQVVDNYWLREENELMAWSTLKEELGRDAESVTEFLTRDGTRHCQILLNTAAEQVPADKIQDHDAHDVGQHEDHRDPVCLVRRHKVADFAELSVSHDENEVEQPSIWEAVSSPDPRWPPERRIKPWRDFAKAVVNFWPLDDYPGKAKQLHNRFFHPEINRPPFLGGFHKSVWYVALRRIRDRGDRSTSEFYHPPAPPAAPTTEIGVEVGDVVDAVDEFRMQVRDLTLDGPDVENGTVFFPIPMGIRFTAASSHYLSPEYDRETAMVELPLPLPQNGFIDLALEDIVEPALTKVEQYLRDVRVDLKPRPHMGKHNTVTAEWLAENYEYFDASDADGVETGWYQAYRRFNAFGTFDNKFTDQLELDRYAPVSQPLSGTAPGDDDGSGSETQDPGDRGATGTDETPPPGTGGTSSGQAAETTAGEGQGFGILTGIAAAGSAAWILTRRLADESRTSDGHSSADQSDGDGEDVDEPSSDPTDAFDEA